MKGINHQHEYKPYEQMEYSCNCMSPEGYMPESCSCELVINKQSDGVYKGHLEYFEVGGWKQTLSPMGISRVTSHYYKVARKLSGHEHTTMEAVYSNYPSSMHSEIFLLLQKLAEEDRKLTTYRA